MLFEICLHTRVCACTHTTIPVGGSGSASYYQLIFIVFFFLSQRRRPYVCLSSTAFNLLLVSAVKTSHLNCWFDTRATGRIEGEHCHAHRVYAAYYTMCVRRVRFRISTCQYPNDSKDRSLTPSLKTGVCCLVTTNYSLVLQKMLSFMIFASFSKL